MTTTLLAVDACVAKAQKTQQIIQAWPHWDDIALCAQKEYGLSPEQFQVRLPEYQRFMALCSAYSGIGMTSSEVDQLWHVHILHTALYAEFCSTIIGHRVDHLPCSSYVLYGVDLANDTDCSTCKLPSIPTTCYGQLIGASLEETRESILGAGKRFRDAYIASFGELPAIWDRSARVADGVAV